MPDEPLPPDASTGPFEERPSSGTEYNPSSRPPEWTNDPDAVEALHPPAFDRYRAHTFHKLGGMGRVWRARDAELGRDVAFKEIRPKFADDNTARARFTFEAEVTGRLDHPAVIPVYGFGRDASGKPFYAMRFVEGQSLQEAVADFYAPDGPQGAERALKLRRLLAHFVTVCRAVDYAHSKGVIHRDLKPLNVMIGRFGETLVVDWGIAKRLRAGAGEAEAAPDTPKSPAARAGTVVGKGFGSPPFWSPEQAEGRPHDHDERTDVYGLGAVLFAVLTGHSPHPDGTHPPSVPGAAALCPWVDAGIDAIARRAMTYDPTGRYPTAAALADAVEEWLADQPLLAQRAAVQALERAAADHPNDLALAEQLARQRSNLGLMLSGMGRDAEAVEWFRAAVSDFGNLAAMRNKARLYAEQANALLALARALAALGKSTEAASAEREAAQIYRRLTETRPEEYNPSSVNIMLTAHGIRLPPAVRPAELTEITIGPISLPAEAAPTVRPSEGGLDTTGHGASDGVPAWESPEPVIENASRDLLETEFEPAYSLVRLLGEGGIGRVYLARDNALGRLVVIKVLLQSRADTEGYRERFQREAEIAATLEHPNLVRIYGVGTGASGAPYMVLEYLDGEPLDNVLKAHGPGWSAVLLKPLARACDGLEYAHFRGIVNRDVKLANIMVLKNGRTVVVDWSISLDRNREEKQALDIVGAIYGTPAYMAPEQARGALIDYRTDIFGLGVCLFRLVTGSAPVQENSTSQVLFRMSSGDYPRLRDVRADVPPRLDAICARAMALRPEDRYPTAAALAADIRAFLDEQKGA